MSVRFTAPTPGGGSGKAAFNMRFVNLAEWLRSMDEDWGEAIDAAREVLEGSLVKRVVNPSKRLCPVDTGALRRSVWWSAEIVAKRGLSAVVGYDTDYALYVHENPDARHDPPTQWKFLEQPMAENGMRVIDDLAKAIAREMGR